MKGFRYRFYGLSLLSQWCLPFSQAADRSSPDILLVGKPATLFTQARERLGERRRRWFASSVLDDGSIYLRWRELFEFLVAADGRQIAVHKQRGVGLEILANSLLSQVLSCAAIQQGLEPIHATAVNVAGEAVGFLGDTGYGKSTLGAAFLNAGFQLITDDLLLLNEDTHRFIAQPALPRIKLFPRTARLLPRGQSAGTPMNSRTSKLLIPVSGKLFSPHPVPLKALYVLPEPRPAGVKRAVRVRTLPPCAAFVQIVKNTFNALIVGRARLSRQFLTVSRLVSSVPVKALSYPRSLSAVSSVRNAILRDLKS